MLSLLKVRSLPAYLAGIYVVAYADIVLVLQAGGLTNALIKPVVVALEVLLTACALILWLRAARPQLLGPFSSFRLGGLRGDRYSVARLIVLVLVGAAVGYLYLRQAQLVLGVLPGNYDALTYHLSRVGYWLQYQSLYPWPTPNPRQTTFPMNAELGVLWTILWWGTDRLSGFVQWTTVPISMLGIYGLTRLLHYSRWRGAMAALLWATLTQVLDQSSSTQNDLVTASFWVLTLYFFFAGLRERTAHLAFLSGLAFGLAIGTKSTSLLVLPGLGLAMIILFFTYQRPKEFRNYFFRWSAACLLGVALFGSYVYVQNTVVFGSPLGPSTNRTGFSELKTEGGITTYAHRLRDNLGRYAYLLVDFSPLPFHLASSINPTKAALFSALFHWLRISVENPETIGSSSFNLQDFNPLSADASWFGPLAAPLVLAAVLQAYWGARRRDTLRLFLVVIGASFLVVESAVQTWTPYKGRYFSIPVALCFPLMACFLQTRTLWRAALTTCLVLLALVCAFTVTLNAPDLQHLSWREAFSKARRYPTSWPTDFTYQMVERSVPANASIGLTGGENFRDYPLFGEYFARHVTLAVPDNDGIEPRADIGRFVKDFQNSDYLFLDGSGSSFISDLALREYYQLSTDGGDSLWIRKELRSPTQCDGANWPFRDFYEASRDAAACPRYPIVPGMAAGHDLGGISQAGRRFVPVIGSGPQERLKFDLLVKAATQARLTIRVDPHDISAKQTLQLTLSVADSEPQVFSAPLNRAGVLRFDIPLQPNIYTVQLGLADGSPGVRVAKIEVSAP